MATLTYSCTNCAYWKEVNLTTDQKKALLAPFPADPKAIGLCRALPPQRVGSMQYNAWPFVTYDSWCGSWKTV